MWLKRLFASILMLAFASGVQAREEIKVVNPSFEETEGEKPAGQDWQGGVAPPGWRNWIGTIASKGKPKLVWEKKGGRTGNRCVSLQDCIGPVCVIQNVPVRPGRDYVCCVWVKSTNPKSVCRLSVRWAKADGSWANSNSVSDMLRTTGRTDKWAELSVTFSVPENAAAAVVLLTADRQGDGDKCWFDDVTMYQLAREDIGVGSCRWIHPNCRPIGEPIETPHVKWAKPYAGGKLKVLFLLGCDHNLRAHIEVAQRMDIECDYAFAGKFEPEVFAFENKKIMDRLAEGYYDVAVVALKQKSEKMAGLLKHCKGVVAASWPGMAPSMPPGMKPAAGKEHFLGEPLDAIPQPPEWNSPPLKKVETAELSGSRLVHISYGSRCTALMPIFGFDEHLQMGARYWEAYMQLVIRAILWAGGKQFPLSVSLEPNGNACKLSLRSDKALGGRVRFITADRTNALHEGKPRRFKLVPGKELTLDVPVPASAASGPVTMGAIVENDEGKVLGFAVTRTTFRPTVRIASLASAKPFYESSEDARILVTVEGDAAGMQLSGSLTDAYGREFAHAEQPAKTGENELKLPLAQRLTTFAWARVQLKKDGRVCDAAQWYVLCPLSRAEWLDEYQVGTWSSSVALPTHVQSALHRLMKEAELTEGLEGSNAYLSFLSSGLWPVSTAYGRVPGFRPHDSDETVRKPCLSDPEVRRKMADTARTLAADELPFRPLFAYLRDETSLVKPSRDLDVCSCEFCRKRFRSWLKERYGDIAKLNERWHTNYRSWDELGFVTYKQVRGKETFAPWLMYRRFMDWTWAEGIIWTKQNARKGDPGVMCALANTFGMNPFSGRDYYLLSKANDYLMEYPRETRSTTPIGFIFDTVRSFRPGMKDHPWIGYRFDDEPIIYAPWWTLFHGATGCAVYGTMSVAAGRNSWAEIFPTLQHTRRGMLYARELKEIKRGIGKLIMTSRRTPTPIAILWSQPSFYAAWAMSDQEGYPTNTRKTNVYSQHFASRYGFRHAVLASGRQFDYVCEEQILEGALKKYSCLVMPASYAVSH